MRLAILLIALPLLATTYYVDKDGIHGTKGNDNYSGLSWSEPWATITRAANTLVAGDSVIIARATYRERIRPQNSGTVNDPIVYYGEPGAAVAGSVPVDESQFGKVSGYNNLYAIYFPDFEIRGVVQLAGNDSIVLRPYFDVAKNLAEVDDTAGSFLQQNDTIYIHTVDGLKPDSATHDLEFIKEEFGIDLRSKDHILFHGFTIRSQSTLGHAGWSVYFDNSRNINFVSDTLIGGVMRGTSSSGITIKSCSVNRLWRISTPFGYGMLPHGMSGMSMRGCDTLLIDSSEIWWVTDAGCMDADCDSVFIANTRWWGCPNHGILLTGTPTGDRPTNITFHRCAAGAECQEAVYIYYADSINIINCDFSILRQFSLETTGHSRWIKMRNTLITRRFWIAESSIDEYDTDYNCVYDPNHPERFILVGSTNYTLSEWQNLSGEDLHSLNEDPLVVNWGKGPGHPESDFYLTENSPCIDAGDPSYPPPQGGGSRIDIGAYEHLGPGVESGKEEKRKSVVRTINPEFFPTGISDEVVTIYDSSGRKIRRIGMKNEKTAVPQLPAGIYFFQYQRSKISGKFIIIK